MPSQPFRWTSGRGFPFPEFAGRFSPRDGGVGGNHAQQRKIEMKKQFGRSAVRELMIITLRSALLGIPLLAAQVFLPAPSQAQGTVAPTGTQGAEKGPEKDEVVLGTVAVTSGAYYETPSEKTKAYTVKKTEAATKLSLTPRETPQSVSVATRAKMDDFHLVSVNDVLQSLTGINVEKVETDRTYYTARGFDITNFQMDGIGIPFPFGNQNGDIDTAVFDRVEAYKGANGLMSSTGNPSATVNFVRKRPSAQFQGNLGASVGNWGTYRLDADLAGPLTASGNLRGRLVLAREDGESYLDRYRHEKNVYHGVLEADLGSATLLTLGYTRQDNSAKSPLWGALPLYYTDGSPTNYDRSTSTATEWSWWDVSDQSAFLEIAHRFDNDWQVKGIYTYKRSDSDSKLFYAYDIPDRSTGLGLRAYPSMYDATNQQHLVDVYASGPIQLAGRTHELVVGANWSRSRFSQKSSYGTGIGDLLSAPLGSWAGDHPEPTFDASFDGGTFTDQRASLYSTLRLNLADRLKLILGGNATLADSRGFSYQQSNDKSESAVTPYVGAIYDLAKDWSLYANYAEIFSPQNQLDGDGKRLKPIEGRNFEVGVKSELFDKNLNASFAIFKTIQDNTAESAGFGPNGSFYKGVDARSQGLELDLAGNLTPRLQATLGYTLLSIEDDQGNSARTFVPRQTLRVTSTYRVPLIEKLKVGMSANWQSEIHRAQAQAGVTSRQGAYLLLGLMARYQVTEKLAATLNLNNVTNEKYLTSLYWDQAFYGAPINGTLALNYTF
jgi:outer-membrane receptor for ferric coprogen and ferric-rhodotorulic acid